MITIPLITLGYFVACLFNRKIVSLIDYLKIIVESLSWVWVVLFSFFAGHYFTLLIEHPSDKEKLFIATSLFIVCLLEAITLSQIRPKPIKQIIEKEKIVEKIKNIFVEKQVIVEKEIVKQNPPCEVIYIMKRDDGIFKFGRTISIDNRIQGHIADYKMGFKVIAAWVVFPPRKYEKIALNMTKGYFYSEGNRKELRRMDEKQLSKFIADFTNLIQKEYNKRRINA